MTLDGQTLLQGGGLLAFIFTAWKMLPWAKSTLAQWLAAQSETQNTLVQLIENNSKMFLTISEDHNKTVLEAAQIAAAGQKETAKAYTEVAKELAAVRVQCATAQTENKRRTRITESTDALPTNPDSNNN